jgi:hypothetical protein
MINTRKQVYKIIDGERAYQNKRWGIDLNRKSMPEHSPQEWLTYIKDYAEEGLHIGAREAFETGEPKQMEIFRKIAAIAVAAMEEHEVEPRK